VGATPAPTRPEPLARTRAKRLDKRLPPSASRSESRSEMQSKSRHCRPFPPPRPERGLAKRLDKSLPQSLAQRCNRARAIADPPRRLAQSEDSRRDSIRDSLRVSLRDAIELAPLPTLPAAARRSDGARSETRRHAGAEPISAPLARGPHTARRGDRAPGRPADSTRFEDSCEFLFLFFYYLHLKALRFGLHRPPGGQRARLR
jgi:hypothetical protein